MFARRATFAGRTEKKVVGFVQEEFKEEFKTEKLVVKDHCHLTGKFRGLAHDKCTSIKRKICFMCANILP